ITRIGIEPNTSCSQKPIQPRREKDLARLMPFEGLIASRSFCNISLPLGWCLTVKGTSGVLWVGSCCQRPALNRGTRLEIGDFWRCRQAPRHDGLQGLL